MLNLGLFHFRSGGEKLFNNPDSIAALDFSISGPVAKNMSMIPIIGLQLIRDTKILGYLGWILLSGISEIQYFSNDPDSIAALQVRELEYWDFVKSGIFVKARSLNLY